MKLLWEDSRKFQYLEKPCSHCQKHTSCLNFLFSLWVAARWFGLWKQIMEKALVITQCLVEISGPTSSQYMTLTANCSTYQQRSRNKLRPHWNKVHLKLLQITNYISDQKSKEKPLYFYYSVVALTYKFQKGLAYNIYSQLSEHHDEEIQNCEDAQET